MLLVQFLSPGDMINALTSWTVWDSLNYCRLVTHTTNKIIPYLEVDTTFVKPENRAIMKPISCVIYYTKFKAVYYLEILRNCQLNFKKQVRVFDFGIIIIIKPIAV